MADIFSTVLNTSVRNMNPTGEDYKKVLRSYNVPEATVDFMAMLYSYIKEGYFSGITNDFGQVTGRRPRSFQEFVTDYKSSFIP